MTPSVQELADTVPRDDYAGFVNYIIKHQELIGPDSEQALVSEAVKALRKRQRRHAENCVEKSLLLKECQKRKDAPKDALKELSSYLNGLKQTKRRLSGKFEADHRSVLDYCERRAEELGFVDTASQAINIPRDPAGRARHGSFEAVSAGFDRMAVSSPEITIRPGMSPPSDPNFLLGSRHGQDGNPNPRPTVSLNRRDSIASRAISHTKSNSLASDEGKSATVQADNPLREVERDSVFMKKLKGNFKRRFRNEAKSFFRVGRVFMIFEHKELSDPRMDDGSGLVTRNERLGIDIISHKTRFVVVRVGPAYCWAVPITTYNNRGLHKPGLRPEEIRSHAIIYTGTQPSTIIVGGRKEPHTTKEAIKVEPVDDSEDSQLHRASRVNFAKPTTIEHNVNAVHIGWVHRESMPYLEEYWEEQVSGHRQGNEGEQTSSRHQASGGEQTSSRHQASGGEQASSRHQAREGEQTSSRHQVSGRESHKARDRRR